MKRLIVLFALASLATLGGSVGSAFAEPSPDSHGCQTVASKFLNEDAPGHQGVSHAANQGRGEGPCGFGDPPGHEEAG